MKTPPSSLKYCIFSTSAGHAALAWNEKGLTHLFLPEKHRKSLQQTVQSRFSGQQCEVEQAPGKAVQHVQNYFAGQPYNFSRLKLDFSTAPAFHQKVYGELLKVPHGCTISYKLLAGNCGNPKSSRAVGQAVGKNPLPLLIPCHRVVNSDYTLGGFSAAGGLATKIAMLELEAIQITRLPKPAISPPLTFDQINIATALDHLSKVDADLKKLIKQAPMFNLRVDTISSPFQALLEAIIYQQLTGKAAATIFNRLLGLFGCNGSVAPLDIIRARDIELRSAGLSGAKIAAARDLAEFTIAGKLPDLKAMKRMSNNEIISCLTSIKGIGRWTAEMLLIFKLGRADIMPGNDYGLQKGLAVIRGLTHDLPGPRQLEEQARNWQPYRSVAAWYLWRAAEMPAGLIETITAL